MGIFPWEVEMYVYQKAYSSFMHSSTKPEIAQVPISSRIDEQTLAHLYNGTPMSNRENQTTEAYNNVQDSYQHHGKWKISKKEYIDSMRAIRVKFWNGKKLINSGKNRNCDWLWELVKGNGHGELSGV